jgi:hypothetical protein
MEIPKGRRKMQTTANKLGKFFFIALSIIVLVTVTRTDAAAAADVLDGITFAGEYTDADVTYLRNSLQLLQTRLPAWRQYIAEAGPLVFAVDLNEGARGHAAMAKCCDAQARGVITFGFHLGQSPDDAGQTLEAQQVAFIGTFVHEVTHIRDQRSNRYPAKTDYKSCVAAEKSGLEQQLEVKRAFAAVNLGAAFAQAVNQQISAEASALMSRGLWQQYCGAFVD